MKDSIQQLELRTLERNGLLKGLIALGCKNIDYGEGCIFYERNGLKFKITVDVFDEKTGKVKKQMYV